MLGAVAVLGIGVGTLAQYIFKVEFHLDQLLLSAPVGPFPGRPSPPTAIAIVLLALAVLFVDRRPAARARPSEWLALAAAIVALVSFIAQLYGAGVLYRLSRESVIGVAVPTAIGLLLTSIGLLLERPRTGIMHLATSPGPGGILLRRLVVPGIVAPIVLGLIVLRFFALLRVEEFTLVAATVTAVAAVVGPLLVTLVSAPLDRVHQALTASREQTRALIEQASDGIFLADLDARYTDVNDAGCRMLGMTRAEIVGKTIVDFIPAEDVDRLFEGRDALMKGGSHVAEWRLRHKSGEYIWVEVSDKILPDGRWQGLVRDITRRKNAEVEARRAQAKIEGIVSIAADAIISIDDEQRIVIFNGGAEAIFGWTHDEAIGRPLDMLIPERFRETHREHVRRFGRERPDHRTRRVRSVIGLRKDGTEFPAEAAISKIEIDDQSTFTVVLRDMTDRVQLEQALRDSRAFLENVLDSSTEDAVIALDLERRIVLWNEGARLMYGYSAEEIVGSRIDALYVEDDTQSEVAHSLYARALDEGTVRTVLRGRRKDGAQLMTEGVASRRSASDGTPLGYLIVNRDVTREHRRAEQERALAAIGLVFDSSIERMQVVESAMALLVPDFADVCIVDLSEDPDADASFTRRKVVHRDPRRTTLVSALAELAWPALPTKRSSLLSHVTPEYLATVAHGEEHRRVLVELSPASLVSVPLLARDRQIGALTFISSDPRRRYGDEDVPFAEDVGRRLSLAVENARLYEVATKAVRARDEVMSIVAHDLRNPLSTISLSMATLLRPRDERRVKARKAAEIIQRSASQANRLIEDLLDITRIERDGGLSIEPRFVSVEKLVRDVVELFGPPAAERSIGLDVALGPPMLAWADENRIDQALGNLLGNALKFTPEGGRVRITTERDDAEIRISVIDAGPGIPPDHLPHVFDRLWQGKRTDRRGAGLGLAIAKSIVEAHGGRLWAESEVGHGSTFVLSLPIARGDVEQPEIAPPSPA